MRFVARLALYLVLGFVVASVLAVAVFRFVAPPITPLMIIRALDGGGTERVWRPRAEISPNVFRAVIAAEDMKFCDHSGFDWTALRAAWRSYRAGAKGARLRGASTITMQTAKNVFLWPSKNLPRKALEAWFTVLIEALWSKERILEVYVNVVEWGDGVWGIEAAARRHFGRSAKGIGAAQAARLAAVLPNPRIFSAGNPSAYVRGRARVIRRRMADVPLDGGRICG